MQIEKRLRGFLLVGGVCLLATACTVTDYKQPVDQMAAAVDSSIDTIEKLDDQIAEARNQNWIADLSANKAVLFTVDDQCSAADTNCSLEINWRGSGRVEPFPSISVIPKARAGLAGLRSYVANLKAIIDADTVNKVTTSANSALGSLVAIEKAIAEEGSPAGSVISDFGEPSVAAISWIAGQYVAYVKVSALRRATRDAQPVIEKLAVFYDTIGHAAQTHVLGGAHKNFTKAQEDFEDIGPNPTSGQIDTYVRAVKAYDSALNATSVRPLQAFATVHEKMARQLSGDKALTLAQLVAAIEDLGQRAKAFRDVVEQFREAAES